MKIFMTLILSLAVILAPSAVEAEAAEWSRTSAEGGVNIEVNFLNEGEPDENYLRFEIYMDTHSGDLTEVDFEDKISFTDKHGEIEPAEMDWEWTSRSAHHPAAELAVRNSDADGSPIREQDIDQLTLIISDLRDADHEFTWELDSYYLAAVPNESDGTVSLVDIDDGEIVDEIKIGDRAGHGIAADPSGRYLYAGDMDEGILYTYDAEAEEIVNELDISAEIHGIDITSDGRYLFISPTGEAEENLIVVDTEENQIEKEFTEELAGSSSHVTISRKGDLAVNPVLSENLVHIIDMENLQVMETVEVGEGPNEARISPDGSYVYVANWESHEITVIDMDEFEVIADLPAGEGTHGVAVSPEGEEIWSANRLSNDVTVFDTETLELKETIASGEYANHLSFTPDGKYVLVTNARDNELAVIDRESLSVITRIEVGGDPHEISFISRIN